MKQLAFFLACLWTLLFSAAQSILAETATNTSPIKVGVVLGLTGPASKWSKFQRLGIELARRELSEQGLQVEVLFEDSKSEPIGAVAAFKKLTEIDHVQLVIGDVFAMLTDPLIPLADAKHIPLIALSLAGDYCGRSPYLFTAAAQVPSSRAAYAELVKRLPAAKRLALITFDDPGWGNKYRMVWNAVAQELQRQVVNEFQSADFNPNFLSLLPQQLAKNPNLFLIAQEPNSSLKALRQLKYSGDIVYANNVLEIMADGSVPSAAWDNVYFVDPEPQQEFQQRFLQTFGEPRMLEAETGYESLRTAAKAMQANSGDLVKAIQQVKYTGVVGPIDYTSGCAGNNPEWRLKQFQSGKITLVW